MSSALHLFRRFPVPATSGAALLERLAEALRALVADVSSSLGVRASIMRASARDDSLRRKLVAYARSEALSRGFLVLEMTADNSMVDLLLLRSDCRVAVVGPGFMPRRDANLLLEVADVDAVWVVGGSGLRDDPIRIQEIVRRPSAVH
jgi:hypothetical protein